jgi:hypothetical protein
MGRTGLGGLRGQISVTVAEDPFPKFLGSCPIAPAQGLGERGGLCMLGGAVKE